MLEVDSDAVFAEPGWLESAARSDAGSVAAVADAGGVVDPSAAAGLVAFAGSYWWNQNTESETRQRKFLRK
jgi:hypothetical protein